MSNVTENITTIVTPALRAFAHKHNPEALFGQPARSGLGAKTVHIQNVLEIGLMIPHEDLDTELLDICLLLHDIGRSAQWNIQHSFNDRLVNHRYIALQMVEQYIRDNKVEVTPDWKIVTDVMQYHGVSHMYPFVSEASLPYVKIVSQADDIENGCLGALGYLEDEKARDDKGYIAADPYRNQRDCNPELFGYLERGEKFNKMELCHTYAEYFIFAAMLAVNACIHHGEIAKKAMATHCYSYNQECVTVYSDAVDGYCRIFEQHLHPEDAKRACAIIKKMCR